MIPWALLDRDIQVLTGVGMPWCQWDSDAQGSDALGAIRVWCPHANSQQPMPPPSTWQPREQLCPSTWCWAWGHQPPCHQALRTPACLCCCSHVPLPLLTHGLGHTCALQVALAQGKGHSVRRSCRSMATPTSPRGTCCGQRSARAQSGARSCRPSWRRESWCPW